MKFLRQHFTTVTILFLMLVVRTTFANQYVVPTGSMIPTIAIGDHILANRLAYDLKLPFTNVILARTGEPARGDVVVFESPREAGLVLVKRLIALPGDRVQIENGFVRVNGRPLDDFDGVHLPYSETLGAHHYTINRLPDRARPDHFDFVVPPQHYFMLGDNRDNSADGRYFGFVERKLLIGRAERVLYSVDFPHARPERTGMKLD